MSAKELAVNGGSPYRSRPFPKWPVHDEAEAKAAAEVADSGKWWRCAYSTTELEERNPDKITGRSRVESFEDLFARAHKARYAVAVSSGSGALEVAVRAAGIKPGDEVITTPYTFIATSTCILNNFAVPVYTDIDAGSYNMDANQIEGLITDKTKAILPVHFSGNLCDMETICAVAKKYNLKVIEDDAHAHGVEYKERQYAGTFGDFGCFSFQEAKNVACGEGGMVITNNKENYDMAFSLHHYGRVPGEIWYKHFHQGWNYRMNEFTAAIGIVQLGRLFEQNARRMENYQYLMSKMRQLPAIRPSVNNPGVTKHSHHLAMLRYDAGQAGGVHRDEFVRTLTAEGVPALTGYSFPNYANPFLVSEETRARFSAAGITLPDYAGYRDRCPNCERACREESIWLEHRLLLGTKEDMDDIYGAFVKIIEYFRSR